MLNPGHCVGFILRRGSNLSRVVRRCCSAATSVSISWFRKFAKSPMTRRSQNLRILSLLGGSTKIKNLICTVQLYNFKIMPVSKTCMSNSQHALFPGEQSSCFPRFSSRCTSTAPKEGRLSPRRETWSPDLTENGQGCD